MARSWANRTAIERPKQLIGLVQSIAKSPKYPYVGTRNKHLDRCNAHHFIAALGLVQDPMLVPLLLKLFMKGDHVVREGALEALCYYHDIFPDVVMAELIESEMSGDGLVPRPLASAVRHYVRMGGARSVDEDAW